MQNVTVACFQPRFSVVESGEEFAGVAQRFLRQAQAKDAEVAIFPELAGAMLAPPLISHLKLSLVRRADRARQPRAGFLARGVGRLADATAGALGGGLAGSLGRLLEKNAEALRDLYLETMGALAREFSMVLVGGSLYLVDAETGTVRNRAHVFDRDGALLGHQDKMHLSPGEEALAAPGTELVPIATRLGRIGLLLGRDALYPEAARGLALQGADLLVGLVATGRPATAALLRSALALRAEEDEVFAAASFLLGPNFLGLDGEEDLVGQSALLAPVWLSAAGDGILAEAGSMRAETALVAALDGDGLARLRESGGFGLRRGMNLGNVGPLLATFYERGIPLGKAAEEGTAGDLAWQGGEKGTAGDLAQQEEGEVSVRDLAQQEEGEGSIKDLAQQEGDDLAQPEGEGL